MRLLKTGQVAKKFGVSNQAVRNWTEAGLLPVAFNHEAGRHRFYSVDAVEGLAQRIKSGQQQRPLCSPPPKPSAKKAYPILTAFIEEIIALSNR